MTLNINNSIKLNMISNNNFSLNADTGDLILFR